MQKEASGYITGFYPGYHPSVFLAIHGLILYGAFTPTRNRLSIEKTSKETEQLGYIPAIYRKQLYGHNV